jgi:hypothetical protein
MMFGMSNSLGEEKVSGTVYQVKTKVPDTFGFSRLS